MIRQSMTGSRTTTILIAIAAGMYLVLVLMGRVWWCESGDWLPWSWDIWSPHNSQHLVDPYSLSHVEHGVALFILLTLASRNSLSVAARAVIVACIEAAWEVAENTPMIINRYREATISLDYYGDSILNSLSDYGMCLLGVLLVRKTSIKVGIAVFVAMEIVSLLWIRDSLVLNIIMLTAPIDAIKQWQAPG